MIFILIFVIYILLKKNKINKKIIKNKKKYDIIYSILFHQKIEYVNNCIENINKYNKNNKFLIIAHLSDDLYKNKNLINKKNVIINPIHFNKKKRTITILKAIIDNFKFLKSNKINYNYCMTLSSTNRFVRETPKFKKKTLNNIFYKIDFPYLRNKSKLYIIILNYKIYDIIKKYNMKIKAGQISGRLFTRKLVNQICNFFNKHNILDKTNYDFHFDELLLPTISKYFMKEEQKSFCHVFKNGVPTPKQLKKKLNELPELFLVKKFPENLNHPLFNLI